MKSRQKREILFCENLKCRKKLERTSSSISNHNYCSHSCAAFVSNEAHSRNPGVVKICAHCSKEFKSRAKYCSRRCKNLGETIPGKELLDQIKDFVKKNDRVPYKKEFTHNHAARLRFGTWNNAIKAAGFDPNPVMFANKHVAKDGHKCDSFAEKIIDDWLHANKINHKRGVPYPSNEKFTCDFVVGDKWIEFFGLHGEHERYDQLWEQKLKIAKKHKLNFIGIYPEDIFKSNKFNFLPLATIFKSL